MRREKVKAVVQEGQRQLILDDYIIAEMQNLKRTLHQPDKRGAVIRMEGSAPRAQTIQTRTAPVWDPEERIYKFWIFGMGTHRGYMESSDGLRWSPGPEMNMDVNMVVRDPMDPDPSRRYKGVVVNEGFATSPDGIHWTKLAVAAVPSSDEANFSLDRQDGLFIHTVKRGGPYGRSVYLATSKDFRSWEDHGLIFHADALDQELGRRNIEARLANPQLLQPFHNDPAAYNVDVYNMGLFRYEGYYIGMPAMFHATGPIPNYPNTDGFHLIQLACSHDLEVWHRLGNRQAFIGPSTVGSGAHDLTQIIGPSDAAVRGNELWFYYTGLKYRASWKYVGRYPRGKTIPLPGLDSDHSAICLAVLRRDGFISLDSGEDDGFLATKLFTLPGNRLYVNVDATGGELCVEASSCKGEVLAKSEPLTGDLPEREVTWKEGGLRNARGKEVRLRFVLNHARLYSFWVENRPVPRDGTFPGQSER